MTKDDLIQMADLVGYDVDDDDDVYAPAEGRYGLDPRLEHFAQLVSELVRQDEREKCAKLCESLFDLEDNSCNEAEQCAAAIRGRTE
jgi:hypothetical protein